MLKSAYLAGAGVFLLVLGSYVTFSEVSKASIMVVFPTPDGEDHYEKAAFGVGILAFGAMMLGYAYWGYDVPLWRIRKGRMRKPARDAALIVIGISMMVVGVGTAALLWWEAGNVSSDTDLSNRYFGMAIRRMLVGAAGVDLLVYGVVVSKGPSLFHADDGQKPPVPRLRAGLAVSVVGILVALAVFPYGIVNY